MVDRELVVKYVGGLPSGRLRVVKFMVYHRAGGGRSYIETHRINNDIGCAEARSASFANDALPIVSTSYVLTLT